MKSETYYIDSPADIPRGIQMAVDSLVRDVQEMPYSDILGDLIPVLEQSHAEYFAEQRAPDGSAWAPLSETTVSKKGHNRILSDKGDLEASLTGKAPGAIRSVMGNELVFGTSVEYAKYHQAGYHNVRTGGPVPARPHVGLSNETTAIVLNQVADDIIKRL